ncbi:hypothetical protein ACIQ1D_18710 [Lysinibacillus xylanilyticus]|uniref:hypothetical protein n=1 Tax=Lysinibacillus xylanilyticus TaxID=582475 RepID=UPI00380BA65D
MKMEFEKLYNSACGIIGISHFNSQTEFEQDLKDLDENPDFTLLGQFDMTQDADEELQSQGFTLDQITKMSLNRYGNVIETLHSPDSDNYWVFVGAR